jgi:hypothetical protein
MNRNEDFEQAYDGVPFDEPLDRYFPLACCHCGLVHMVKVELADASNVRLTFKQNAAATKRLRRSVPQKCVPVKSMKP